MKKLLQGNNKFSYIPKMLTIFIKIISIPSADECLLIMHRAKSGLGLRDVLKFQKIFFFFGKEIHSNFNLS